MAAHTGCFKAVLAQPALPLRRIPEEQRCLGEKTFFGQMPSYRGEHVGFSYMGAFIPGFQAQVGISTLNADLMAEPGFVIQAVPTVDLFRVGI